MLRKKLKLDHQPESEAPTNHPTEFTLKFTNEPKPKLPPPSNALTSSAHFADKTQPPTAVDDDGSAGNPFWQRIYQLELQLCEALKQIALPSEVAAAYNPIEYAANLHTAYMQRFLDGPKPVLFLGMNPGPWGMCQTGVPFGYVPAVRDWMQLQGKVLKPIGELPARPVEGLNCARAEQSGQRWWGLYQELCGPAENFFRNCFVFNLCPLAFFHASGRNITPADLKGPSKTRIQDICNEYLRQAVEIINPTIVVSVGRYCEDRVKALVKLNQLNPERLQLRCMPHPSPRSLNNTNWPEKAQRWLEDNGVMPYLKP